mgnify:FL=1
MRAQKKIASMLDNIRQAITTKADDFTGMLGGKLDDISRELSMTGPTAATGATIGGALAGGGAMGGLVLSELIKQYGESSREEARQDAIVKKLLYELSQGGANNGEIWRMQN